MGRLTAQPIDPGRRQAILRQLPHRIELVDRLAAFLRSYDANPQDHWEATDAACVSFQYHLLADEARTTLIGLGVAVPFLPNANDLRTALKTLAGEQA